MTKNIGEFQTSENRFQKCMVRKNDRKRRTAIISKIIFQQRNDGVNVHFIYLAIV